MKFERFIWWCSYIVTHIHNIVKQHLIVFSYCRFVEFLGDYQVIYFTYCRHYFCGLESTAGDLGQPVAGTGKIDIWQVKTRLRIRCMCESWWWTSFIGKLFIMLFKWQCFSVFQCKYDTSFVLQTFSELDKLLFVHSVQMKFRWALLFVYGLIIHTVFVWNYTSKLYAVAYKMAKITEHVNPKVGITLES